ncbi:RelA/SpoT domain-containing protein [Haematobacter missouriensis]|uniref:RelA/SpoT domain-containing protein n=1 Tax=Haematobacter missouriensis TaxID=366616 RepID=A0ABX3ZQR5_9RHOB|nr:RelA/SpoT domain-containing protein [Haematobacter missouriensis]OWJ73910.1 hypothetical protein CDV53_14370 [Haematobacter missouriensis]
MDTGQLARYGALQNQVLGGEDDADHFMSSIPVADYPKRIYSFGQIKRAGKILSEDLPDGSQTSDEVLEAFRIAHNWRMAHALPMIVERKRLAFIAKGGFVTSGRVKRMASIRKKLTRGSTDLRQMQDLGGCRAVMPSLLTLGEVVARYTGGSTKSTMDRYSDYLSSPKSDGYRGIHLILNFEGVGQSEEFSGQKLEIQVRTRLQHSWSTAVEVIGAVLNQDLKAGGGDDRWRLLLALMSDYYALCDGVPLRPAAPQTQSQLCRAIREVECELGALAFLKAIRDSMSYYVSSPDNAWMYRLSMDSLSRTVAAYQAGKITAVNGEDYDELDEQRQTVIVSVDTARDLPRAFPNFYLDVSHFTAMLVRAVKNRKLHRTYHGAVDLPQFG